MRTTAGALLAVPLALAIGLGGAQPAFAATGGPHGDRPVAAEHYQYRELNYMSSNYLMRYSGQDGPPGDFNPADGNQPPDVNGWQEFYRHWAEQVTSPKVMGRYAGDLRVDDHDFRQATASFVGPPPPYDSDVRTVTIPGASCPGQTVLIAGHPDSTTLLNSGNGSSYDDTSGITMGMAELKSMTKWWAKHRAWPKRTFKVAMFDGEEEGLYGSQYYASHLIPPGPQGKIVLVANMDQNGIEYPAHPAGSTQTSFGPGFWYTNVNASPLKDFSVYTTDGKPGPIPPAMKANLPAIRHFREALQDSVGRAFKVLGAKYHFRVPLENPNEAGATVPAYRHHDIAKFTPVQDDTLGRTDQVPFVAQGIPGYGIVGAFDSDATDNPLEQPNTPLTPLGADGIPQIAGYDTPRDNMTHLNLMTSGTTGGQLGATGSVELKRALELPMTWTLYLIAKREYVGRTPAPTRPVAYFEALPTAPAAGVPVQFNGLDTAANGNGALHYAWDFGDGHRAVGATPTHAYQHAGWYLAKLAVRAQDGRTSGYEQLVNVGSVTTHRPASNTCGHMTRRSIRRLLRHAGTVTGPSSVPTSGAARSAPTSASVMPPAADLVLLVAACGLAVRRRRAGRRRPAC
jgi:hypothetical protein